MNIFENIINFISKKEFYVPIFTIAIAYILFKIVKKIFRNIALKGKTELEKKRRKTIIELFENVVLVTIVIIAFLIILETFGVNTGGIIAGLGIAGLVIGFALQDTLKDIISGVTIFIENYYVLGDTVEYKGFKGEVINLGLRSTKIQKYSGEVQIFANRNVDLVINYSQKNANQLFEIVTDYDINIENVEKIIKTIIPKLEKINNTIAGSAEYLGVNEITATGVKHLLTIKCKRMTQYQVKRDVLKLLKKEFDNKKIKISIT